MKLTKLYFTLVFLVIIAGLQMPASAQNSTPVVVEYDVLNNQNATVTWYDENFNPIHYQFSEDDNLTVSIYDLNNSETNIDITLGNLTLTNIPDSVASNNLILSYWKLGYSLGFVANASNWENIKIGVENLTMSVHTFTEKSTTDFFGVTLSIIEIVFEDGVQATTLVYEKETGLLLSAETGAFGFTLKFRINTINGGTTFFGEPKTSTTSSSENAVPIAIIGIIMGFAVRRRKL